MKPRYLSHGGYFFNSIGGDPVVMVRLDVTQLTEKTEMRDSTVVANDLVASFCTACSVPIINTIQDRCSNTILFVSMSWYLTVLNSRELHFAYE